MPAADPVDSDQPDFYYFSPVQCCSAIERTSLMPYSGADRHEQFALHIETNQLLQILPSVHSSGKSTGNEDPRQSLNRHPHFLKVAGISTSNTMIGTYRS